MLESDTAARLSTQHRGFGKERARFLNVTLGAEISAGSVNFDVTQTEVE